MAKFDHVLDEDDSKAIQAYVIATTQTTIEFCKSEYRKNYPELLDSACTRPQVTAGE